MRYWASPSCEGLTSWINIYVYFYQLWPQKKTVHAWMLDIGGLCRGWWLITLHSTVTWLFKHVLTLLRVSFWFDGCCSSKFLRAPLFYFFSPRQEVRSRSRRASPLKMVKFWFTMSILHSSAMSIIWCVMGLRARTDYDNSTWDNSPNQSPNV